MHLTLFKKELREQRWIVIIAASILAGLGIFTALSFNMIAQYQDLLTEFQDILGPQLGQEFERMLHDYNYYIWSQWQPKGLVQMGTIIALILASTTLAGEVGRGSIQFLTSLPLGRTNILLSKAMAGISSLSAIIWASTLVTLLTAQGSHSLMWGKLLTATVLLNIGLIAIYCLGLIFSALGNDAIKAGAMAAATIFVWSGAGLLPSTYWLSPFWHMKGAQWFIGTAPFPWTSVMVLLALGAGALWTANFFFSRRQF